MNKVAPFQSLIAGMVEVLGFLTLGGPFTAHVTGNLVLIAAALARHGSPSAPQVLALPTFIAALGLVWLFARSSNLRGPALLRPLMSLELLLLSGVLLLVLSSDVQANTNGAPATVAAVLATSAIACQFAMMRLVVPGSPSTAVMTGNLTNSILSALDLLAGGQPLLERDADRARKTSLIVIAFCVGAAAAALAFGVFKDWAWSLPVLLSAAALAVPWLRLPLPQPRRVTEPAE